MPDPSDVHPTPEWLKSLVISYKERSSSLAYRGKKKEDAAMDFMCGAAKAFELAGEAEKAQWLGRIIVFSLSLRGFSEMEKLLER
jgi:hypothetical protein